MPPDTVASSPADSDTHSSHTARPTVEKTAAQDASILPTHNRNIGSLFRVDSAGESGRRGFHPVSSIKVAARSINPLSAAVNFLWPTVPVALVMHFARPDLHLWIFGLNMVAIIPTANLLGFAGSELAKKLPKVIGVLVETLLGGAVEIVLFMVLISNDEHNNLIAVIQAAILGSILANLLLCLGLCFFVGGLRRDEQSFHGVISETGSGLLLVAGFGLLIPSAFYSALAGSTTTEGPFTAEVLLSSTHNISRATAVILLAAFFL